MVWVILAGGLGHLAAADPVQVLNPTARSWFLAAKELQTSLVVTIETRDGRKTRTTYPAWERKVVDTMAARGVTDEKIFMDYYNFFMFKVEIPAGGSATIETMLPMALSKAADFIPLDSGGDREVIYSRDGHYDALWDRPTTLVYRVNHSAGKARAQVEVFGSGPSSQALFARDPAHPTVISFRTGSFGTAVKRHPFEGFPALPQGEKPFWWSEHLQAAQDLHQGRDQAAATP